MIARLVKSNSKTSIVEMRGLNGHFYSNFQVGKKIYVLKVSQVICSDLRKVEFKFNKNTNIANKPTKPLSPNLATISIIFPITEKSPKNFPNNSSAKTDSPSRPPITFTVPERKSVTFVKNCILIDYFLYLKSPRATE